MPATFTCIEGPLLGKSVHMELGKVSTIDFCNKATDANNVNVTDINAKSKIDVMPLVELDYVAEGWCLRSDMDVDVNGNYVRDYILKSGDKLHCHDNTFVFESDEIVSLEIDGAAIPSTDSESIDVESTYVESRDVDGNNAVSVRRGRRLSASHDAVIHSPAQQKKGILERVGKALRRKDGKIEKLEELEEQRQKILHQAGRFVLEYQGGMGLPNNLMMDLFSGQTVTVEPHQLRRVEIEQFRLLRDRLIYLDSAVNACRLTMGLEEEDRNPIYELHLRRDTEKEEDQAYAAMDDLGTIEHEHDITSFSQSADVDGVDVDGVDVDGVGLDFDEMLPDQSKKSDRANKEPIKTEVITRKPPASSRTDAEVVNQEDDKTSQKSSQSSARRRVSSTRARRRRR